MEFDHLKVIDWIRANWTKPSECPICGSDNWVIGNHIIEMHSSLPGSPIYPFFFVICRKCAYTIFFNAVVAGLVKVSPNSKGYKKE